MAAVQTSLPQCCPANFTMEKIVEQRVCLKFCVANEISCADALKMLKKAYGDSTMSKTRAYEWFSAFKEGREVLEDLPRFGRPSTFTTNDNIEKIKHLVLQNRRFSVRELAREVNIDKMTVHGIITNILGMKRVAARLVPKDLNLFQKHYRKQVAEDMISRGPDFLNRIITGDETWVYEFDTLTSQQSTEWRMENEPNPKKARRSRSKLKVLLTVFFGCRGVVHSEFLPEGQTVNKDYYLSVLRRLRENIRRKRPELWRENSWILHDDNAPAHRATIVADYKAKNSVNSVNHPPYSPDLAPCDFFLFPKLKLPLRGTRFSSIDDIKRNSQRVLKAIPESAYQKCMEDWFRRFHMCIANDGDYFEGDKINFDK